MALAGRKSVLVTHKQVGWYYEAEDGEWRFEHVSFDGIFPGAQPVYVEVVAECDFTSLPDEEVEPMTDEEWAVWKDAVGIEEIVMAADTQVAQAIRTALCESWNGIAKADDQEMARLVIQDTAAVMTALKTMPVEVLRWLGGQLCGMDARMRTPVRQSSWLFPFGADLYHNVSTGDPNITVEYVK